MPEISMEEAERLFNELPQEEQERLMNLAIELEYRQKRIMELHRVGIWWVQQGVRLGIIR